VRHLSHVFLAQPAKKSGIGCSRSESFLRQEDGVLLVYWLMRSGSVLISEFLTTTMEFGIAEVGTEEVGIAHFAIIENPRDDL
jgi:hypothetical protein